MKNIKKLFCGLFIVCLITPIFIQAQTGAKIRVENMTKMPGTDIGFPADNWFVFNRLRTNMNPKSLGHIYSYDDKETIRINNDGTEDLILVALELSNPNAFAFQARDFENLPITVKPGEHYDLIAQFVKNEDFWPAAKGVYFSDLTISSNAGEKKVTLAGHYQLRPEGAWEPTIKDVSDLFGFNCKVPFGHHTMDYPTPVRKPGTDYGELVVSEFWEQADQSKSVTIMFIYALGGGGHPNLKLLDEKDQIVSGVDYKVNGRRQINGEEVWVCQTVFPNEEENPKNVAGVSVNKIEKPFKLSISNRTTSGTGDINPETGKPATLAFRFFHVKDKYGIIRKPNDYLVAFDVVPINGSHSNGDFNDYVLYVSNVQPKGNKPEIDRSK